MSTGVTKLVAFGACLVLAAAAIYVFRPNPNHLTCITVVGDHQQRFPDAAIITFSVVTQAKQALDAQQENAGRGEAVKKAV